MTLASNQQYPFDLAVDAAAAPGQAAARDRKALCATNRNLAEDVADDRFRRDLFHRTSTMPLIVPPQRDRLSDLPMLADWLTLRIVSTTCSSAP